MSLKYWTKLGFAIKVLSCADYFLQKKRIMSSLNENWNHIFILNFFLQIMHNMCYVIGTNWKKNLPFFKRIFDYRKKSLFKVVYNKILCRGIIRYFTVCRPDCTFQLRNFPLQFFHRPKRCSATFKGHHEVFYTAKPTGHTACCAVGDDQDYFKNCLKHGIT